MTINVEATITQHHISSVNLYNLFALFYAYWKNPSFGLALSEAFNRRGRFVLDHLKPFYAIQQ